MKSRLIERNAADQLDIEHADRMDRREFGAPSECDQDAEREAEREPEGGEDQRHRQSAPALLRHEAQSKCAAPHQEADQRERPRPDQHELPAPEGTQAGHVEQRDEDQRGERRPPLLLERIGAEQDESVLLGDHRPARAEAARGTAGGGVVARHAPDRVQNAPLHEADQHLGDQREQQQRDDTRGDRREQIGAQPAQHGIGVPARSGTSGGAQLWGIGGRGHGLSAPPARYARYTSS